MSLMFPFFLSLVLFLFNSCLSNYILCDQLQECQYDTLNCTNDENCAVDCYGQPQTCYGAYINGRNSIHLTIQCGHSSMSECESAQIVAGIGSVNLTCSGSDGCKNLNLNASTAGDVTVHCDGNGYGSCRSMIVICGIGDCFINC
eukprot:261896_1